MHATVVSSDSITRILPSRLASRRKRSRRRCSNFPASVEAWYEVLKVPGTAVSFETEDAVT